VKYYLRHKDSKVVDGPLAPHDIHPLIPSRFDLDSTLAAAANGQSMRTLLTTTQWEPLAEVLKRENIDPSQIIDDPLKTALSPPSVANPQFISDAALWCIGLVLICSLFLIGTVLESPIKGSATPVFLIGTCAAVVCFFILGIKHIVLLLAEIAGDRRNRKETD
jgi:hypothetical protein